MKGPHNIFECRRSNILGTLVQDASPFLFPCTIEYSLICAAILYVMWRNVCRPQPEPNEIVRPELHPYKRSPHHYSVDCAGAHKGLFIGILMLVLTIISLIIFFVLISKPEFTHFAVTEVNICELVLYGTTTIATILGMIQVRVLHYDANRSFSLGKSTTLICSSSNITQVSPRRRYPTRWWSNRIIPLQHLHHNRRPSDPQKEHDSHSDHRTGFARRNRISDDVHT